MDGPTGEGNSTPNAAALEVVSIVSEGQSPGANDGDGQRRHGGDGGGAAVVADGQ